MSEPLIFNSQAINTDPQPFLLMPAKMRVTPARAHHEAPRHRLLGGWVENDPRPEFGNCPNPLLVWFRGAAAGGVRARDVDLNYAEYDGERWEHVEHARRVLLRLIALEGGAEP